MSTYQYKAVSKDGAKVSGVIEAYDEYDAVVKVKENCAYVTNISQVKEKSGILTMEIGSGKVKQKSLSIMCSQFSVLIRSGLSITRTVKMITDQTKDKKLKKILEQVSQDVSAGHSLASSFESKGPKLPATMIETIRAGEESGALDKSFDKLAVYFEKSYKIKAKVGNALTYPIFVLIVAAVVMMIMMVKVIPTLLSIFDQLDTKIPISTKMLIASSKFFQKWWLLMVFVIAAAIIAYKSYERTEKGREKLSKLSLKMPIIGKIVLMNGASQFANTMSTLLSAGISVSRAIDVTSRVLDNYYLGLCTNKMVGGIEMGKRLGACMTQEGCFPDLLSEMTSVGEETGALEETLSKTALYFDNEVETSATRAISMLEPALLIATALIAGFIVISLYLPMFSMYSAM
ncbi:MAG: type II secretion system F family protein [Clostridia bacterium]|jgi:type IV pilus assembly protein PilC|nr:type II secretion system F family protein [Clostridia bacterium]MCI2014916.1 type II secretion system F family protein [Clostridia bacterium]